MTLVERLRTGTTPGSHLTWTVTPVHLEAAAEIERLEKALETAREALQTCIASMEGDCEDHHKIALNTADAAIRTLSQKKEG